LETPARLAHSDRFTTTSIYVRQPITTQSAAPVGEHGARLSGGQRLALARVLLAGFPIVILDEPAEHLDQATAEALMTDLLSATAGRTVVLITHRLPRDAAVDGVSRLEDGRLMPVPPAGLSP
jgi:ATP-binding cassette subfamily C protein CydCD